MSDPETTRDPEDIDSPIFVVGCPRSGTTLLQRMLDAHPHVAIAGETHFVSRFWIKRDEFGDLRDDANFDKLIDAVVSTPEFGDLGLDTHRYAAAARAGAHDHAALFRLLLVQYARLHCAERVGEKTPDHLVHAPVIAGYFPSSQFLHIVRDPRAVASSTRRVPWATQDAAQNADVWRKYMVYARTFSRDMRRRIHTVRYEALVSDPEKQLRSICEFLGLSFEPAMLEYHNKDTGSLNVEREPWKINATKPIRTSKIDEWRSKLTPATITTIEAVAWREMTRHGYEPITGYGRLLPAYAGAAFKRLIGGVRRKTARWING